MFKKSSGNDNYNTPRCAFEDLQKIIKVKNKKIYDPFYNDGVCENILKEVFDGNEIIHKNVDFWSDIVDYDIIITNPPFSDKKRVLNELYGRKKPFCILLPVETCVTRFLPRDNLQLIIPSYRYKFTEKTSYFGCMWYCYYMKLENDLNLL